MVELLDFFLGLPSKHRIFIFFLAFTCWNLIINYNIERQEALRSTGLRRHSRLFPPAAVTRSTRPWFGENLQGQSLVLFHGKIPSIVIRRPLFLRKGTKARCPNKNGPSGFSVVVW
jgi:hypothetical protein